MISKSSTYKSGLVGSNKNDLIKLTTELFSFNKALFTDGDDDLITFDTITELNSATAASLNFWMKVSSGNDMAIGSLVQTTRRFGAAILSNVLYFFAGNVSPNNGFGSLAFTDFDTYVMITLIFDGGLTGNPNRLKGFVDNSQKTLSFSNTIPGSLDSNMGLDFEINRYAPLASFGQVELNEISLFDYALSPADRTALYNSRDGADARTAPANPPIGYWRCNDEDGSSVLVDVMGNYNGTLNDFISPPIYFGPNTK